MSDIRLTPPKKSDPGYLKRLRRVMVFQETMKNPEMMTAQTIDEIVEFLADYVTEPEDRDEVKSLLWEASEDDFALMFDAISGGADPKNDSTGTP